MQNKFEITLANGLITDSRLINKKVLIYLEEKGSCFLCLFVFSQSRPKLNNSTVFKDFSLNSQYI